VGVDQYERLRTAGGGPRHGLAVLTAKGMVAFLRVAGTLLPARSHPPAAPVAPPARPGALEPEIIRVWSRMVLAHAP
jgi:hypothetical protein